MVDYQDGASRKAEPKLNAMLDSPAGYRLGGLLDQLSEHRRTAEEAADTKSAKQQKKQQEDLTGGEIARFAALRGMKRAHSDSAINKENGGGDIQTLFEDSCPVRKRPKAGDEQLRAMLEANAQRDEEFRRNVITRLDEGNKIQQEANRLYAHAQQDLVSILQKALQQEHAG
ncbi:hypothetical protein PsYK624_049080 [Phanerochaete sordida]|uniref:Uncharacterized protein n=1 Tax=Phanerochaete sordida TaxID=48140 RepID=A0A9P3G5U5_9APHY|nr:hypothetical protein PsYK624_049080 [Phanerochaete sordida]